MEIADANSSTLNGVPGRRQEVAHGSPGRVIPTHDYGRELTGKINQLERVVRGAGRGSARAPGVDLTGEKSLPGPGGELQKSMRGIAVVQKVVAPKVELPVPKAPGLELER